MSGLLGERSEEARLLKRARRRDPEAVDALYSAHIDSARHVAALVAGTSAAEDLVADSFARVIDQLHAGRGPSENFRAYLLATIRNRHRDIQRRVHRERPASHQPWILEEGLAPIEGPEAVIERTVDDERIVTAYDALPEDWREVLWHLELRDRSVPEVATMMGLNPAAVSSLAYRAREGLRLAYLDQIIDSLPPCPDWQSDCQWTRDRLSRYVRGRLGTRAADRIELHLKKCDACAAAIAQLDQTNRKLAGALLPALVAAPAGLGLGTGPMLGATVTPAAVSTGTSAAGGHLAAVSALASWKAGAAAVMMVGLTSATSLPAAAAAAPPILPAAQVLNTSPTHISTPSPTANVGMPRLRGAASLAMTAPLSSPAPLAPQSPFPRGGSPTSGDPSAAPRTKTGWCDPLSPASPLSGLVDALPGVLTETLVVTGTLVMSAAATTAAAACAATKDLQLALNASADAALNVLNATNLTDLADGAGSDELHERFGTRPSAGPGAPTELSPLPDRRSPVSVVGGVVEDVARDGHALLGDLTGCKPLDSCLPQSP